MSRVVPVAKWSIPWLGLGMLILFGVSLGLRFWGLERFNALVFDEVYYANFATSFLQGEQEFGGHPPLSNYFIAIGIWVGERLGLGDDNTRNTLTGMFLSTVSYRWMNALVGAFFPVVVGAIAFQLTYRPLFALLSTLLATVEGMFLVESRYALNNIYLVLLGLLGYLFLLLALNHRKAEEAGDRPSPLKFWLWLILAGVGFGGSIAIKWNGAGFLLGAIALWLLSWLWRFIHPSTHPPIPSLSPLSRLSHLPLGHRAIAFAIVPFITYWLSWQPYLTLGPNHSFWDWQQQVLSYHQRVGGPEAHAYCSRWFTWPLMQRPVAYFYESVSAGQVPSAELNVSPPPHLTTAIYDVHAMGNPILWWFSTLGMVLLVGVLGRRLWMMVRHPAAEPVATTASTSFQWVAHPWRWDVWTLAFLVVNWGTNWLPWVKVTRCTFIYHYMGASVFALLAIALWLERGLHSPSVWHQRWAIAILLLIVLGFFFWLPFFLGLPLSPEGVQMRRWFPSWI